MTQRLTVGKLFERMREPLELELLGSDVGFDREITSPEASSPGLVLAGYINRFPYQRIQVLGETEISFLQSIDDAPRAANLEQFFGFPIPCAFITKHLDPPAPLLELAAQAGVAVLRSRLKTAEFYRLIKPYLADQFAPTTTLHGSLADVYGVGVFFTGKSGIGKSECVLDLVERGHRLVADDLVFVSRRGNDVLIGRGHELQRHFMEIRGVGLLDIPAIFGIHAVRQQKRIEVVVILEEWDGQSHVDRTGLDVQTTNILGVEVPRITVHLNPGKNITVIAEVIAMNHLLRYYRGYDSATAFNERLIGQMRRNADVQRYLQEDDE
ncbi:MAG: HPr(Ser) kinase/phosphatase [Gemmatimonadaceae bacterium]|nr:HPr(Ser) kinase/phosphatase [Gemmatimonadaceae bacterium]MCC6429658.1 HPr(Ser) kinase/phosphatase [Gemmatimonadaceae bacterium]